MKKIKWQLIDDFGVISEGEMPVEAQEVTFNDKIKWYKPEERLPEVGQVVLAWYDGSSPEFDEVDDEFNTLKYIGDSKWVSGLDYDGTSHISPPSYWCHLPSPPKS